MPTLGNILWMVAFFGVLLLGPRMMNRDGDLGRHLTIGNYILDTGNIPVRDLFSHTMAGQAVTPHEWLAQVVFALAERILGLDGIVLICGSVIAITFSLLFSHVRTKTQGIIPALLAVWLAWITSALHWLTRPHLFTFLLLALWMLALHQFRIGNLRRWWLLPAIMLFWANLHGGFIAGFITWLFFGAGIAFDSFCHRFPDGEELPNHFWRYYLLGGTAAFVVSLFNPSGIGLWQTILGFIGNQYLVSNTLEYLPPNFHKTIFWPFLIFIGLLVSGLGFSRKWKESGILFSTTAWLIMGLYSARNIPLFAIVAAPLLAQCLDDLLSEFIYPVKFFNSLKSVDARIQNVDIKLKGYFWPGFCIVIAVVGFISGVRFDFEKRGNSYDPNFFPVGAANWLQENPQEGEMFNYFPWGGYLLYRQWPEKRVFIDGQTDFYGEELKRQYMEVIDGENGWEDVLNGYQITWAILPPYEDKALAILTESNWVVIYEDRTAFVLRRK